MNKAKAIFAAGVIVVVAGSSAGLWYLNENGYFGEENTSGVYEEYEDYDENDGYVNNDDSYEAEDDGNTGEEKEETQEAEENNGSDDEIEVSDSELSEFLSVFTKAYFYDNGNGFSSDSYSDYELIRFAYAHINRTDNESVIFEEADDAIRYYYKVSAKEVNAVLDEYLGITVPEKSVYTENDYAFFRYADSYFYTPAADGLPYINTAEINSAEHKNGVATVTFTVFSAGEKYAEGEAKISTDDDSMKLVYYKIKQ